MKQLQEAFDALLPTNEQEERMLCEILVARNGKPKRRSRNNPVRVAVLIAAALAMCVVTASAAEILGVSQMIRDYFQKKEEVSVMDKLNVAAKGLSTTTEDGWTFTITDLFGDYNRIMMGVTLEAPEGTILKESDYNLSLWTEGSPHTLPPEELEEFLEDSAAHSDMRCFVGLGYLQSEVMNADQVPDDNPNDNKISFVFDNPLDYYQDGITVDFHFEELRRYPIVGTRVNYKGEIEDDHEKISVKEFDATIPGVATHFSSNGYHLTPNASVQAFGENAIVSKLTFTPLSVSFELTGYSVNQMLALPGEEGYDSEKKRSLRPTRRERYQRWWDYMTEKEESLSDFLQKGGLAPRKHKDITDLDEQDWAGWTNFWELDTPLVLHFKDGTTQELNLFNGDDNRNADTNKIVEGEKKMIASYRFDTPLDMDTVDYITVCDVRISLPAEAVK